MGAREKELRKASLRLLKGPKVPKLWGPSMGFFLKLP